MNIDSEDKTHEEYTKFKQNISLNYYTCKHTSTHLHITIVLEMFSLKTNVINGLVIISVWK